MSLNAFDYSLLVIILLSVLLGFRRGFFAEVLSVLTWVIAFFVAILFTHNAAAYAMHYIKSVWLANVVSFIVLFIATLIVGALVRWMVMRFTDKSKMSVINRLVGGIFGVGRGILIALLLVFIFSNTALQKQGWFQNAMLTHKLQSINHWINVKASTVDWKAVQTEVTSTVEEATTETT